MCYKGQKAHALALSTVSRHVQTVSGHSGHTHTTHGYSVSSRSRFRAPPFGYSEQVLCERISSSLQASSSTVDCQLDWPASPSAAGVWQHVVVGLMPHPCSWQITPASSCPGLWCCGPCGDRQVVALLLATRNLSRLYEHVPSAKFARYMFTH